MDLKSLENFFVVTDPKYPNWIGYPRSYREEIEWKQREKEQKKLSDTMRQMGNPSGGAPSFGIKGGDPSVNPPNLDEKGRNPSVNFPQTPSNPLRFRT
jgi:hypothetical protein